MKIKNLIKAHELLKEKHQFLYQQFLSKDEDDMTEEEKQRDRELIKICDEMSDLRRKLIDEIYNRIKIELHGRIN
jgi:hypothetical protein